MSVDYERMNESKSTLIAMCLDGHDIWSWLTKPAFKYKLARTSGGVIKYYNQGAKIMSTFDFIEERKSGKIVCDDFEPKGETVIMLSCHSQVENANYPHLFKRGRMMGFVFNVGDWSVRAKTTHSRSYEMTPEIVRNLKLHKATFSTSTGQVTIHANVPNVSIGQGPDFMGEYMNKWWAETKDVLHTNIIQNLHTTHQDKLKKLVAYFLSHVGVLRDDAEWLRTEVMNLINTTEKPWPYEHYKLWADGGWMMIDDKLRPDDYTREDFMERWRVEGERGEYLESLPLEERLKEITEKEINSFCWWMSDESRGFFVDWRLCLTDEEALSLSREKKIHSHLSEVAIKRWQEAQ